MDQRRHNEIFNFTVGQLVEALQTFPADLPILISGYENGYENFYLPEMVHLKHEPENYHDEGTFQVVKSKSQNSYQAVVLIREKRSD